MKVHDKENLDAINSRLDNLKEREELKETMDDHLKYRRFSLPLLKRDETLGRVFQGSKNTVQVLKLPRASCKLPFLLASILLTILCASSFCYVQQHGIEMKLLTEINNTATGMLQLQENVEEFIQEFKQKSTVEITPQTSVMTTITTIETTPLYTSTTNEISTTSTEEELDSTTANENVVYACTDYCTSAYENLPVIGDCHKYCMCVPTEIHGKFDYEVSKCYPYE